MINKILSDTQHRPNTIPKNRWTYYQEWNEVLFLHWKVPLDKLRKLVPENLNIDTFEGNVYVSLVAFTMKNIRPRYLSAFPYISDFHEINIRTYVHYKDIEGIYFLNIEAEKQISVMIAKLLSGLPYEKSYIFRTHNHYHSRNLLKGFSLDTKYEVNETPIEKTALDIWLTERYNLYFEQEGSLYRYDVHHPEWDIKNVDIKELNVQYNIGDINLTNSPDLSHYSKGVKVLAWKKILC